MTVTIASVQTMQVPEGVCITQQQDWARNAIKIRVLYQDRKYDQYLTNEMLRHMSREQLQSVIDSMVARVMKAPATVLVNDQPQQDIPGGLINFPVAFMDEGEFMGFELPDHPEEHFLVRFLRQAGPMMLIRLEWPGHGMWPMSAVSANGTVIRDVIAEGMAMASVLIQLSSTEPAES